MLEGLRHLCRELTGPYKYATTNQTWQLVLLVTEDMSKTLELADASSYCFVNFPVTSNTRRPVSTIPRGENDIGPDDLSL